MSDFLDSFNLANDAFAAVCSENFDVVTQAGSAPGAPGTYSAVNITMLEEETETIRGGQRLINTCMLDVYKTIVASAFIGEGTKLSVRGGRVRVNSIQDDGDSLQTLVCGTTGVAA